MSSSQNVCVAVLHDFVLILYVLILYYLLFLPESIQSTVMLTLFLVLVLYLNYWTSFWSSSPSLTTVILPVNMNIRTLLFILWLILIILNEILVIFIYYHSVSLSSFSSFTHVVVHELIIIKHFFDILSWAPSLQICLLFLFKLLLLFIILIIIVLLVGTRSYIITCLGFSV